jgi:hypothetical protein
MRVAKSMARSGVVACALLGTFGACSGASPNDLLGPGGGVDDAGVDSGGQSHDMSRDSGAPETSHVEVDSGQDAGDDASKGQEGGMSRGEAGACGPQTCNGCCDANGTCTAGTSDAACGTSGAACSDCTTLAQTCTAGACSAAQSCSMQSCKGCCQGTMCMPGTSTMACGTGGKTCQMCRALCLGSVCF